MSLFGGWGFDKSKSKTRSKTRSKHPYKNSGKGSGSRKKLNKNKRKSQKLKNNASGSKHIKYAMRIIGGGSLLKRYLTN